MLAKYDCIDNLRQAGISREDAEALRRISMTLHRWHELECGTDEGCIEREQKYAITRAGCPASDRLRWWNGKQWDRQAARRTYDEYEHARMMDGLPTTRQWNSVDFLKANAQGFPSEGAWRETREKPFLTRDGGSGPRLRFPIADREAGALKRLAAIVARYPGFGFYVQGDPRGASLYILRPGDVKAGETADSVYTRGIAVFK